MVPVITRAGRKLSDVKSHQDVYPVPTGRFQFQTSAEGRGPDPSAAGQHTSAVHEKHGPGSDSPRTSVVAVAVHQRVRRRQIRGSKCRG